MSPQEVYPDEERGLLWLGSHFCTVQDWAGPTGSPLAQWESLCREGSRGTPERGASPNWLARTALWKLCHGEAVYVHLAP